MASDRNRISTAGANAPIIRATGLRKTFRMGDAVIDVLKGVDLSVKRGEFLAIEGKSGSGKSTLMHVLSGLDAPDFGTVEVDGRDIAGLASRAGRLSNPRLRRSIPTFGLAELVVELMALSRLTPGGRADYELANIRNTQFGFVFQFYHLLPELSVLENTMLSLMIEKSWLAFRSHSSELRARAEDLLTQLGMEHRLHHKPNQLSGGERQRVAIARALMNEPRVLFADEPTGNLDAETGRQIMDVLERLHQQKGQTILMVTHDRALAREADRVLLLKDGRLQAPPELPASPDRLDAAKRKA